MTGIRILCAAFCSMRIAFLTSRFPYPVEKGDKLRAYRHLCHLCQRHEVHLLAVSHQEVPIEHLRIVEEQCASVRVFRISRWKIAWNCLKAIFSGLPVQVGYFLDARCKQALQAALISIQPDHVFAQLIRTAEYVRRIPFPKTLDYMDTFSVGAGQRSRSGSWLMRPFFAIESFLLRRYERQVYADFTNHAIISSQDRERLPLPYRKSVVVLPNGVDADYFKPSDNPPAQQWDVVFVGNMGYFPNIEAAQFLAHKIMPSLWDVRPETTLCIAGARPDRRVRALRSARVEVTGWVEDIRTVYARGRVFVAPMFSGMGQQNKILEAMAMQRPCITTAIVNYAIGAEHGTHVLLAASSKSFAENILRLLNDCEFAESLAHNARTFVRNNYGWDRQNKILDSLIYTDVRVKSDHVHA